MNGPPNPVTHRRPRAETALLLATVVLLGLSLLLPWWSETEAVQGPGAITSTQNYSPITGVTYSCSRVCGSFGFGPPIGPTQGTETFTSLGLNQTADLYDATLAAVAVGLASGVIAFVVGRVRGVPSPSSRRARIEVRFLNLALLSAALGSAMLAWLQPMAFRADSMAAYSPNTAWTASPSPETSFWGGCSPGPTNGFCASGWSAAWGPGPGWDMIVLAALLLVVIHLLMFRRARQSSSAAPPTSG